MTCTWSPGGRCRKCGATHICQRVAPHICSLIKMHICLMPSAPTCHSRKQRLPWTFCANLQLCDKQRGGSEIGCRLNFEDLKLDELKKRTGPPDRRLWSLVSFNWWQMKQLGGSWCFYRVSQKKFLISDRNENEEWKGAFKAEQSEKGWHFGAKIQNPKCHCHHRLLRFKIKWKGPPLLILIFSRNFLGLPWYLSGVSKLLRHHSKSDLNFAK